MVNVTEAFLRGMKKIMKGKGLPVSSYVICIICDNIADKEATLRFLIVPLVAFEKNEDKLPFKSFVLYKKSGCWLSCDNGAWFGLVNSRISINKEGGIFVSRISERSKNSIGRFTAKCLFEHMKSEKLTKKELAINLKMTIGKLNSILRGSLKHIDLSGLIAMSFEFQGRNKISSQHFVIVEKYLPNKKHNEEYEYEF